MNEVFLKFWNRSFFLRLSLFLLGFGIFLLRNMGAYAGSSDTSGYMNDTRLLASGNLHPKQRVIEGLPASNISVMGYVPLGFLPRPDGSMYPTYAMGLPVTLLLGSSLFGWSIGPGVVMWLYSMGAVILLYLLVREFGLGREFAFLGSLLLATSPVFIFMAVQTMSDVPAAFWAILAALTASRASHKATWSILAGFAFTYGYSVRPTNLLMLAPIVCLLPRGLKSYALFLLGCLPIAIWTAVINHWIYGAVFTTGYGNISESFALKNFIPTMRAYSKWLPIELTPLISLLLIVPFGKRFVRPAWQMALFAWIFGGFVFYSFYVCTHETWWYMRFLLPAYPAVIIVMLLGIHRIALVRLRFAIYLPCALGILFVLPWNMFWGKRLHAAVSAVDERRYRDSCVFIRKHIPATAALICMQESGALTYYTENPLVRWDTITEADFYKVKAACARAGIGLYLVIFPFEQPDVFKKFSHQKWDLIETTESVGLWRVSD